MKSFGFLISVIIICSINSFAQKTKLDKLAAQYFTKSQIDTMSEKFILAQNYNIRYSWNIYRRWDKGRDTVVQFNRDTIDIRSFLKSRKKNKPTLIYNVYPGLVIELDSQQAVDEMINRIYSGK